MLLAVIDHADRIAIALAQNVDRDGRVKLRKHSETLGLLMLLQRRFMPPGSRD